MCLYTAVADAHRWRRQADESPKKDDSLEQELCKDKDAGEWFRLVAGEGDNCRDVIQCTASVTTSAPYTYIQLIALLYTIERNEILITS